MATQNESGMVVGDQDNIVAFAGKKEERKQLLARMFREHGQVLRAFLLARMGDSPDVDDIMQEVFLRLSRMEDIDGRLSHEFRENRSFILTIANNLVVDLSRSKVIRRRYQQSEQGLDGEKQVEATPEIIADYRERLEQVERAILSLPPVWRKAFVMNRFKHLSYRQIAVEMGVSPRSVEKYIGHALAKIRRLVGALEEIE
ncbi:RNA polymerase sigma factor [Porticoccaceae bacterium LTM1]|nr:RNA polymerase sigma factor [Porticoccaceae bacterium LTM1]